MSYKGMDGGGGSNNKKDYKNFIIKKGKKQIALMYKKILMMFNFYK